MRRQLIIITTLTAIAQGAGFLKLWLTARLFGVGPELDGYYLALVMPTFVSGTLSGLLQTALFPVRARLAAGGDQQKVARFERGVIVVLLGFGLAISASILLAGSFIITGTGGSIAPPVLSAAGFVLPFAALLVPLNGVGDGLGYLLAMRDRYSIAAAAPIANALLGAAMLAAWPEGGLFNLALGTVAGVALQVAICAWALARTGFVFFADLPAWAEFSAEWREMFRLAAWIVPGVVFANLTATLPTVLIAPYGEGAVSAFGYAWRLHQYAIQLLVMAASPVLLARFSQLVAAGNERAIRRLLRKATWLSCGLGVLAVGGVALLGEPLLTSVFSGQFDATAAALVADHWLWLTVALGPAILGNVFAKVWQARGRSGLMSLLAGVGLAVLLLSHAILARWLGPHSVAAAIGLSSIAVLVAGWRTAFQGNETARAAARRPSFRSLFNLGRFK